VDKKDRRQPTSPNWAAFDSLRIDKVNAAAFEPERIKRTNERNFAIVMVKLFFVGAKTKGYRTILSVRGVHG
jgi:hypothetical protein